MSTRPSLSIGDLAARTGVPVSTIRSWEARHGFLAPSHDAGRHRRYAEEDVAAVEELLAHRRSGLSLEAAVQHVTSAPTAPRSVFAEVRRHHPEVVARTYRRPTLIALSHAIEDECCALAAAPALFGGFQRREYLARSWDRWSELARTARSTVVFAHADAVVPGRDPAVTEVVLPDDSALNREWFVVCDADDLPAVLCAVELPHERGTAAPGRRFEAVWSVDPRVVRTASRAAVAIARQHRPDLAAHLAPGALADDPRRGAAPSADLLRAAGLFDRMLAYLERGA
ncbi:DICT sensory domain-containing protein [Nocardioides zeicaulis]